MLGQKDIPEYEDSWNSYFTMVEGHHASIFLNMGLAKIAPVSGYHQLLAIDVQYPGHDENGLPTSGQAEILFRIEDALETALKAAMGSIYAGRMTYHMQREFYFYLPSETDEIVARTVVEKVFKDFPDYAYSLDSGEEQDWTHYLERLYPSEEERQTMNNMSLLSVLVEQGDDLQQPRMVRHWCYFRGDNVRALFKGEITEMGFGVLADQFHDDGSELPFSVHFERKDVIGFHDINDLTLPLYHLAKKYNGYYDGWETEVLKPETPEDQG